MCKATFDTESEMDQPERTQPNVNRSALYRLIAYGTLLLGLLLLIGPLWLLNSLSTEKQKLIAISILIVVFVVLLVITGAKIFETLAAAAA
jgi:hypothetical protein